MHVPEGDENTGLSLRARIFRGVARLASRHHVWVISIGLLLALAGGLYGLATIQIIADQDELLSEDLLYHRRYRDFIRRFGDLEFVYIVIEGGTDAAKIEFADRLAKKLDVYDEHFTNVLYRFDTRWGKDHALAFFPTDELRKLVEGLLDERSRLEELAATPTLNDALAQLTTALETAPRLQQSSESQTISSPSGADDTLQRLNLDDLRDLVEALEGKGSAPFAELDTLVDELRRANEPPYEYFWTERHNFLLMLVMPRKDFEELAVIEEPLRILREAVHETEADVPSVTAGLTGRPVLQADEMRTTNNDMRRAGIISFVGVLAVFILFFRELGRPLLAGLSLLAALGWTFGFVALTLGQLNLLSVVFAIILVGLGIDFGIHVVHRYQEELGKCRDTTIASERTLLALGSGLVSAAMTSAAPFYLAMLTDFKGMADLGVVAGTGILLCLVAMTVLLPALLAAYDRDAQRRTREPVHLAGLRHGSRHPKTVLAGLLAVTLLAATAVRNVRFDDNLLDLQAEGLESVEYEKKLLVESENSTWFCVFLLDNLDEVRALHTRLEADDQVGMVESLATVLPPELDVKARLQARLAAGLPSMPAHEPSFEPDRRIVARTVAAISGLLNGVSGGGETTAWERVPSLGLLSRLRAGMAGDDLEQRMNSAHASLFRKPREAFRLLHRLASEPPLGIDSIPTSLRDLYVGRDGSFLVRAYPQHDVWQSGNMEAFVRTMRLFDDTVAGTPIQVYESSRVMREAFLFAAMYALIAVNLLIFMDFVSLRYLILTLIPLAAGIFWLAVLMGMSGTNLNLANFFAVPILFGIGVDNAIHLLHRFRESRDLEDTVRTTGTTLTLTSLTTSIGFGSLLTAHHRGLQSLGGLMLLGGLTCWFASVVFLPNLLRILPESWLRERVRPGIQDSV